MGSTLTGSTVASTYQSLLKVSDNSSLTSTLKTVTDGSGVEGGLQLSTTDLNAAPSGGNFTVNTNKFTVAGSSGNTLVAGTLNSAGTFTVNTNKFTVLASSGNSTIAGTLTVNGNVSLGADLTTNNRIVLNGNYGVNQNSSAASNSFAGSTSFTGLASFIGGIQIQSAVNLTDNLTVAGVTTLNGNVVLGNAAGDTITVNGTPTFAQEATFTGAANFNGNVVLGNTVFDTVTVNASVSATTKATPASTDYVYIQDAAASNSFKKTLVSSLLGSGTVVTKKESGLLTVPVALSSVSYNHALGVAPTQFQAVFVCDQTDCGFVANDELAIENVLQWVKLTETDGDTIPGFRPAFSIYCDSNYIYARRTRSPAPLPPPSGGADASDTILTYNKSTGDISQIDPDNWRIKFRMISL